MEEETQGEDHEAFQQALILFAGVALVVATFTIYNTLLDPGGPAHPRVGAPAGTRRIAGQVLRSVTAEALAVGLLASVGGIAAGMGLAMGPLALMDAIGLTTPASRWSSTPARSRWPSPSAWVVTLAGGEPGSGGPGLPRRPAGRAA